jgi:hypothetical protein
MEEACDTEEPIVDSGAGLRRASGNHIPDETREFVGSFHLE